MNRCVMAATDGEPQALGALRCARDLGDRLGLPLEVISVCEPTSAFGYGSVDLVPGVIDEMADAARNIRRSAVNAQLLAAGVVCQPLVDTEIGPPAPTIARAATRRGACMIVVGRGNHGRLDRVLSDETALRLMQASHLPVLSVPETYRDLPVRCLAAIDFTSYSLDAARNAVTLVAPGGELHLVHVASEQSAGELLTWRETEWMQAMRRDVEGRLDAAVSQITDLAPDITVTAHLVSGRPVKEILRLAETLEVDMLAAGTNGYGFLGRLLMGSVATQLVRRSRYMTLIAPPRGIVPGVDHSISDILRGRTSMAREAFAES